ncbi:MAG: DUF4124 domain-containing protein [Methylibium sp.]|uniref:DUF4124 domain-containing protein n=1 Tax=Methylibium sp. TaxID=2067992 RepID=UPI0018595BFD|nr:DUF4124 domain-containing protein [Methylibium sp.]MBA3596542.1 DUF4124 domain-containing protein [Methylibium sp.]
MTAATTALFSRCLIAAVAAGALLTGMNVHAQWKWRDDRGQVQYSDTPPPPGTAESDVLQRPRTPAPVVTPVSAPAAAASAVQPALPASAGIDPALEARRKQAEAQEVVKSKAEEDRVAQVRAQNCERARAYMRSLESGQRMARTTAKGEREVFDDAIRARETAQTRQVIASECR